MKRERNIITMNELGNISLPTDIGATAMTELKICELFGITAPTFRTAVKAIYKSGVLRDCEVRRSIRLSDKCSMDVYSLEMVITIAFRIGTYGAERVRQALLDRIAHGRKEKTTVFVSVVSDGMSNSRWQA